MTEQAQRAQASLYSILIGDALSMPVHWFYRVSDILRAFPPDGITRMQAAPAQHPSSIMSLHSTQAGGRRSSASQNLQGEIVGDVILKGKRSLWGGNRNHYHHEMQAGDNTLNACCARLMMRHLIANDGYDKDQWLQDYIAFMTADSPQHPDTYAESYHRGFFANFQKGLPADKCGAVTHDTPSMGALVTVGPLALALLSQRSLESTQETCCDHVRLTHPDAGLLKVVSEYVSLMNQLLHRDESPESDLADVFIDAAKVIPGARLEKRLIQSSRDAEVVGGLYSTACYITDSWPSVCYLAAKYHAEPAKSLLVNTNLGGENAHRGSVLGSLVGLASGDYDESLFSQLCHRESIAGEVDQFIKAFWQKGA